MSSAKTLREDAEKYLTRYPGGSPELDSKTPDEIIYELRVHQAELEIQNEELKRSQQDLEDARDRYLDLYDFAPVGYVTLTDKGLIAEINLTGAAMLRGDRRKLIHTRFRRYIAPDEHARWDRFLISILNGENRLSFSIRLNTINGTEFSARLEGTRIERGGGSYQIRIAISDNTECVRADSLCKENQYNRSLIEVSIDPFIIISQDGTITDLNHATMKITGRSREELIGTKLSHHLNNQPVWAEFFSLLKTGPVRDSPLEIRHRSGTITQVLCNASGFSDDEVKTHGFFH